MNWHINPPGPQHGYCSNDISIASFFSKHDMKKNNRSSIITFGILSKCNQRWYVQSRPSAFFVLRWANWDFNYTSRVSNDTKLWCLETSDAKWILVNLGCCLNTLFIFSPKLYLQYSCCIVFLDLCTTSISIFFLSNTRHSLKALSLNVDLGFFS